MVLAKVLTARQFFIVNAETQGPHAQTFGTIMDCVPAINPSPISSMVTKTAITMFMRKFHKNKINYTK